MVQVVDAYGQTSREFEYKNHIMVFHGNSSGLKSYYSYDEYSPQGKVLKNHTNYGESWSFEYHDGKTKVTDHLGREKQYYFDNDDYPIALVNALG